jgi:hypothetical protein
MEKVLEHLMTVRYRTSVRLSRGQLTMVPREVIYCLEFTRLSEQGQQLLAAWHHRTTNLSPVSVNQSEYEDDRSSCVHRSAHTEWNG